MCTLSRVLKFHGGIKVTIKTLNKRPYLWLLVIMAELLSSIALAGSAEAQSTDLDHPVTMTTNEVTGRWPTGKATSYFYSFEGGPGQIMVMFDFAPDHDIQNVAGELTDSYGRGIGNLDDVQKRSELSYNATPEGLRS